ncbi:putative bifunctional diguanylate cyclase/phosphodiesterase [Rhizobium leguminosarum]|uniref:putative bifunctional diguanylate cyclase/phosphodiesterase n=1 Tax=Rhizobium leguminosarum TaxID=384 RepID=UPI00103BE8F3|nr:EAL domain-containing protein [Rhizobium leguminosarum]MBY5788161.1 EAL domain-containing protein [Rhizobium leguminosarum]MCA2435575.1 EAL domain-containing protein [Rhizobium leguminosarum]NEH73544.1 EAL domain-containing protein [Rhizobium leguminosarum]NEJ82277.1 EAL domain-containing protein [Rhizobium leguminosarum]NKJ82557.1 EAL domain-containing protein [Rhizobium leguminosarum bv. viciae]
MHGQADELLSFYGHDLKLVECSEKMAAAYRIDGDASRTLWQVYPELQNSIGRSHVKAVLASGLPRTITIEPEARSLLLFRGELGLGVIEKRIGNALSRVSGEDPDRALLLHQARHDALTGLANRRQFSNDLETSLPGIGGHKLALMQIDLDDFKPVNDTLGHGAGDVVLKMTAERIQALLRDGETAYRLAGDEFAVIQRADDQPAEAERLAESLVLAFKEPFTIEGISVFVGASVGIAIAPDDGSDGEQLMKAADIALYAAKNDGRGRARMFNRSMMIMLEQREMLRRSLRVALREQQFFVEYQPVVEVAEGIVGFEALLRWRHPYAGVIPPSLFIPMAESDGLMAEIGTWVLEQACREALTWPSHCIVAVNLSPAEFLQGGFTDRISSILDKVGLPADRLELEITETVLLERTTDNLDILHTLEVLGIRIGLDDFGTRYSSLSYLQNFPFDTIKIDRHFITDIETNPKGQTIVRFIIGLAHGLGMQVTAEGVETAGQAAWLGKRKCDRLQGNFLGAPMSAKATRDYLQRTSFAMHQA